MLVQANANSLRKMKGKACYVRFLKFASYSAFSRLFRFVISRTPFDPLGSIACPHHCVLWTFDAPLVISGVGLWSHAGGTSNASDSAISGSPFYSCHCCISVRGRTL